VKASRRRSGKKQMGSRLWRRDDCIREFRQCGDIRGPAGWIIFRGHGGQPTKTQGLNIVAHRRRLDCLCFWYAAHLLDQSRVEHITVLQAYPLRLGSRRVRSAKSDRHIGQNILPLPSSLAEEVWKPQNGARVLRERYEIPFALRSIRLLDALLRGQFQPRGIPL
jgi:hypothetical protein